MIRIALFRGINVGGRNTLPMKELSAILADVGCRNVRTYIQSGNAVFETGERSPGRLASRISAEIGRRCGFEPDVLLLDASTIEDAIAGNPFPQAEAEPKSLHVGFLVATPKDVDLGALEELRSDTERYHLRDALFYLHAPDGIGRSKLAARAERHLGVSMTVRNWRTVVKVAELAKEMPE